MNKLSEFKRMWSEYPSGEAEDVKRRIGGAVDADWITNTCTIRVSRSLNYAGHPIPSGYPGLSTVRGKDGKSYAIRVRELKAYFEKEYGPPTITHRYAAQGGAAPPEIRGKHGVICFDVSGWSDATGHFDLWNGSACANHGYFDRADAVHLWLVEADQPLTPEAATPPAAPPRKLSASVGKGGVNKPEDVKLVQTLLAKKGLDPGPADGVMGDKTQKAILAFQARFASSPDGRIDVNGRTIRELLGL